MRVADVDGDGRADIVVSHRGHYQVGLYLQKAAGTLGREELYEGPYGTEQLQTLVVSDLGRDGLVDIVICGEVMRQLPLAGPSALRVRPALGLLPTPHASGLGPASQKWQPAACRSDDQSCRAGWPLSPAQNWRPHSCLSPAPAPGRDCEYAVVPSSCGSR